MYEGASKETNTTARRITKEVDMNETANTHRPVNRTLTVVDGGLNGKARVQTIPTSPKPKLLRLSPPGDPNTPLQLHDRESLRWVD
jgi:hypothetical protein